MGPVTQAFWSGLLVLLAPAHVVALVGLAVAAGRNGAQVATIGAFALGLAVGLGAIAWGVGETLAPDVLLAAAAICGLLAAILPRVPAWLAMTLAPVIGITVGLDSPPEVTALNEAVLMLIGTACCGVIAFTLLSLAAAALARLWQGIALRVAGSWVAAIAILVLALRWAG